MSGDVLVQVESVSKKFCRSLKRSLWYGVQDVSAEIFGRKGHHDELRKNEFWAVNEVSFELKRGECLGLIGPNGAGKSTLLKMLNGLVKPDKGRITMRGRVGALIELGAGFNPVLTGRENIYVNSSVLGFSKKEVDSRFDEIVEFAEITPFLDTPVQNYSSGMVVRLGFAVASQLNPDVLIIDEVLAVGDLGFRIKCFQSLLEKKDDGASIVLVSHNLIDIMRLADTGLLVNQGKVACLGSVSEACSAYSILLSRKERWINKHTVNCIESIRLMKDGKPSDRFETGDDIVVEITVRCDRGLEDARMNFHLDSSNQRLNSTSNLESDTRLSFKPGLNHLTLTLENVDLLQGGYILSIDLYGRSRGEFYDHADPVEFYITGPSLDLYGYGVAHVIRVRHRWDSN